MINQIKFGEVNGKEINLFQLTNANGMTIKVMNYGATITSIQIPTTNGDLEIACGFDRLEGYFSKEYLENAPYFGGTVGRYCSQIKDARFALEGKEYQLAEMVGKNNLHGGLKGFDKQVWTASISGDVLSMYLVSPDGDEGFPGEVQATVSFRLTDQNEIQIDYKATVDQATPLSMTNHTYFNLSGFKDTIEDHVAKVTSNRLLVLDDTGAATGEIMDVSGNADDMQRGRRIKDAHQEMGDGFEHFYVFDSSSEAKIRAEVLCQETGVRLEVFSTEPCMLLYTGKYTADNLKRESGLQYGKYRGFCCETHRFPNGPNIENSPGSITLPDEDFTSQTIFRLSW